MKEALRNIKRRKARSALTIFGVAIGIFALTTMGSLAIYFDTSLKSILNYYSSRVVVTAESAGSAGNAGFFAQGGQLPIGLGERLKLIDGVDKAYPTITLAVDDNQLATFNTPQTIYGVRASDAASDPNKLKLKSGRELTDQDLGKVVIGSTIVADKKVKVGDTVTIRNQPFEVAGTLEKTNGGPDTFYIMNLSDAQDILRKQVTFNPQVGNFVTDFNVTAKAGVNLDNLARTIDEKIGGVTGIQPSQFRKQIEQGFQVFNLIILGSALIAVLVGGLSVINTMVMSVAERRKEIGIKRVVGAKPRHIFRELLAETGIIGFIGGVIGVALGAILTSVINRITEASGITVFQLTPELAVGSILFATGLGLLAGIYPAWRAIRVRPVKVLREE